MKLKEKLEYAQAQLALAEKMKDHEEISKWTKHVLYWKATIVLNPQKDNDNLSA